MLVCLQLLRAAWKMGSGSSFIPAFLICPGPSKQMLAQVIQMETREWWMGLREIAWMVGWKKTKERKVRLSEINCKSHCLQRAFLRSLPVEGPNLLMLRKKHCRTGWPNFWHSIKDFHWWQFASSFLFLRMQKKISAVAEWMLQCTKT